MKLSLTPDKIISFTCNSFFAVGYKKKIDELIFEFQVDKDFLGFFSDEILKYRREHGLWEGNCLEIFLGTDEDVYYELNFSPISRWNCYKFDSYRSGMTISDDIRLKSIELITQKKIQFTLDPGDIEITEFNLSAVVQEKSHLSYYALSHKSDKPDFHDRSLFKSFYNL